MDDPSDPRSRLRIKELVRYSAAQKGRGAATDSFIVWENAAGTEDGRGYPPDYLSDIGVSLDEGFGAFQAVLVWAGLKGDVRVDDGT